MAERLEFALSPDDVESAVSWRSMLAVIAFTSVIAVATIVGFEAARSPTAVVLWLVNIGTFGGIAALAKRERTRRQAELTDVDLRWRSFGMERICPWEDIGDVHASDLTEVIGVLSRLPLRVLGIKVKRRVVAIELKRRVRKHPWRETLTTRGFGIPITKRLYIEPVDMDGFLEAGLRFLNRRAPEERWGESRLA